MLLKLTKMCIHDVQIHRGAERRTKRKGEHAFFLWRMLYSSSLIHSTNCSEWDSEEKNVWMKSERKKQILQHSAAENKSP